MRALQLVQARVALETNAINFDADTLNIGGVKFKKDKLGFEQDVVSGPKIVLVRAWHPNRGDGNRYIVSVMVIKRGTWHYLTSREFFETDDTPGIVEAVKKLIPQMKVFRREWSLGYKDVSGTRVHSRVALEDKQFDLENSPQTISGITFVRFGAFLVQKLSRGPVISICQNRDDEYEVRIIHWRRHGEGSVLKECKHAVQASGVPDAVSEMLKELPRIRKAYS
jgi:hypothetical protein